jgi:hypothetical protein
MLAAQPKKKILSTVAIALITLSIVGLTACKGFSAIGVLVVCQIQGKQPQRSGLIPNRRAAILHPLQELGQ